MRPRDDLISPSTDLEAEHRTDDGAAVRSVTVDPHSGLLLTTP